MDSKIELTTKFVGDIRGSFYVPSYQRGYRWSKTEIVRLLDDIYATEGNRKYCLQPVVVRRNGDRYELIDGQQRLTTIYLIYSFMHEASGGFMDPPQFTLTYETRKNSGEFLQAIDSSRQDENIDFYFICQAHETIKEWFAGRKKSAFANVNKYFDENIKIIWYEVDEAENEIGLFTRLNIGKISLTNAELVKAMFLSRHNDGRITRERQEEISLQWDNIEKGLCDDSLWYFLINRGKAEYATRIDIVLDLIAQKPAGNRDEYYTFFQFEEMSHSKRLEDIWHEIQQAFLVLRDWHSNHEFYHKIGYLIASQTYTLQEIFDAYRDKTKQEFRRILDGYIRESISIQGNYADLSYEKAQDQRKMAKLLLLFNVESVRRHGAHSQWFPFDRYKFDSYGKVTWSLEHIHAQHSEGLKTQEMWKEWLRLHIPSVEAAMPDSEELIESMEEAINDIRLERQKFEELQRRTVELLSVQGNVEYLHAISNMALLNTADNAVLNNSTFDVKRNQIIAMDKAGQYIPFCTRMVFLKYYTPSGENQLHFWGHIDRVEYIKAINSVLADYLGEPITLEKEERSNI